MRQKFPALASLAHSFYALAVPISITVLRACLQACQEWRNGQLSVKSKRRHPIELVNGLKEAHLRKTCELEQINRCGIPTSP